MFLDWLSRVFSFNNTALMAVEVIIIALAVFGLTVLITHKVLPVLIAKKCGQNISGYVKEHESKQGTPTMGGICFIMATLVVMLIWFILEVLGFMGERESKALLAMSLTLALGVANGMIGFIDDYAKLVKKQNEGLSDGQKMALQMLFTAIYLAVMAFTVGVKTSFEIPFTSVSIDLKYFAYVVYFFVIVGFINSTNITDGIDGLASSVGLASCMGIMFLSFMLSMRYTGVMTAALMGALLGFLVYNHYPARLFMGDTGSLYIGGIIMGCAVAEGELITFIIISFVFVLEMLSSLWQRLYFKLTHGKRFFKMAPIHHHFQKLGFSEVKIVILFFAVSLAFAAVGVLGRLIH